MGSIFSKEGSKDNRSSRGGGGEEKEEGKRVVCFAYEPPRLNQDFVFTAYGTKDDNKNGNWLSIPSVQEKEKKGIMIFISIFIFILAREVTSKLIEWKGKENENEWKREENANGNGKAATSSNSSSFSSLSDELQLLIMSKVPVCSLVKFRCVSKTWRSWIYKEHFFFGKCPLRTDGVFLPQLNGFAYFHLPDNDNYDEEDLDGDSYTIFYPTPTSSFPFPRDDRFKVFHHASNGLLLLSTYRDPLDELLVHNPMTRQTVLLPMPSQKFSANPLWIGYEPHRSPYFNVVHAVSMSGSDSPVLQIFSSRSWTWCDLVTDSRLTYSPSDGSGRAVTNDGRMFIDLTFLYSIVLIVDLHTRKDYVMVPPPPGLPPRLEDAWSVLGMCVGSIMYAYSQSGVLLVYKLLHLEQGGDYRWTLLIKDTSLQDRLASKFGTPPTYRIEAQDFLLHVPVLLISSTSDTGRCKIFSYNFTNGSILELFEYKSMICKITSLSVCPLEICSGDSSL